MGVAQDLQQNNRINKVVAGQYIQNGHPLTASISGIKYLLLSQEKLHNVNNGHTIGHIGT
jgi:hypothetical protein